MPFVAFGQGLEHIVVTSGSGNGNASANASASAAVPTAMAEPKAGSGAARAAAAVMAAAATAAASGGGGGGGPGGVSASGSGDSGAGAVVTPQLRHKIEKLALDLLKMENEKFSIPALKLLLSCMYVGKYKTIRNEQNNKSTAREKQQKITDGNKQMCVVSRRQSRIYTL